jgi:hypothetical protein
MGTDLDTFDWKNPLAKAALIYSVIARRAVAFSRERSAATRQSRMPV